MNLKLKLIIHRCKDKQTMIYIDCGWLISESKSLTFWQRGNRMKGATGAISPGVGTSTTTKK